MKNNATVMNIPADLNTYLMGKRMMQEDRKERIKKGSFLPVVCSLILITIPVMWIAGMR